MSSGDYATLNLSFGVGDRPQDVLENRHRAAAALGAGLADFVFGTQVHGAVARVVTGADGAAAPLSPMGESAMPTPWSPATREPSWGCWSPTACRSFSTTPALK